MALTGHPHAPRRPRPAAQVRGQGPAAPPPLPHAHGLPRLAHPAGAEQEPHTGDERASPPSGPRGAP
eukprot:9110572-Lingulodinium_polyedra.AAC.1